MTREEKQLLLIDLCARLPYGVHLYTNSTNDIELLDIIRDLDYDEQYWINGYYDVEEVKPYLRPVSSMTDVEVKELYMLLFRVERLGIPDISKEQNAISLLYDWLNKNMFDYRGLIPQNRALEAPEGMYKEEQQ